MVMDSKLSLIENDVVRTDEESKRFTCSLYGLTVEKSSIKASKKIDKSTLLSTVCRPLTFFVRRTQNSLTLMTAWLAKNLKPGDLYALIDVASGLRPNGLTQDQAHRLAGRGMVRCCRNGTFLATMKGRLALLLRKWTRGRSKK